MVDMFLGIDNVYDTDTKGWGWGIKVWFMSRRSSIMGASPSFFC